MKKIILITCLAALPFASFAEESDFGVGAKISTLGAGLDLSYKVNEKISTRLNFNNSSANYNETTDGVTYNGDLKLSSTGILFDYHPFASGFRLTGGLYNNKNKLDTTSTNAAATTINVGGDDYTLTGGTIALNTGLKSTAPYLGLGWGSSKKGLNFSIDAGVLIQGSPNVKLAGSGTAIHVPTATAVNLATNATFQTNLATEEKSINDDLSNFKQYPVIALGINYNF